MTLTYAAVVALKDQVSGPARQVSASVKTMSGNIRQAQQQTRAMNQQLQAQQQYQARLTQAKAQRTQAMQFTQKMGGMGAGAMAAGATMSAALKQPTNVAISFEKAMSKVQALTRLDLGIPEQAKQMKALEAQALHLGSSTSFSASQAASAQSFLAMAGFKPNAIMKTMPNMLNLAKAGDMDLARTADISSNILSGFGLKPEEMERVGDVMAYTFTTSNVNLSMLGETMKYVAPIASKAGGSIEEVAAMVGMLGDVGIQGSMAGTALRSAFLRLADAPKPAMKALNRLGVKTMVKGKLRPMIDVLAELKKKMGHLESGEQIELISTIFGAEAASGMTELISNVDKLKRKHAEIVDKSKGTGATIADIMSDNTAGKINNMKSAAEGLSIAVGNLFKPHINANVDSITKLVQQVTQWIGFDGKNNLAQYIADVIFYMSKGLLVSGALLVGMAALMGPLALLRYGFQVLGLKAAFAVSKLSLLGRVFLLLKASVMVGVLGVVGAFTHWEQLKPKIAKYFPNFAQLLDKKFEGAKERIKAIKQWLPHASASVEWSDHPILSFISQLSQMAFGVDPVAAIRHGFNQLLPSLQRVKQSAFPILLRLKAAFVASFSQLQASVQSFIASGQLEAWLRHLEPYLLAFAQNLEPMIKNALAFGAGIASGVASMAEFVVWMAEFVGGWENLGKVFAASLLITKLSGFLSAIASIVTIVMALGGSFLALQIKTLLSAAALKVWNLAAIQTTRVALVAYFKAVGVAIMALARGALLFLLSPIGLVITAIAAAIAIWYKWDEVMGYLQENFPALHNFLSVTLPQAIDTALSFMRKFLPFGELFGAVFDRIEAEGLSWKSVFGGIMDWLEAKIQSIKDAVKWVSDHIPELPSIPTMEDVKSTANWVTERLPELPSVDDVKSTASNVLDGALNLVGLGEEESSIKPIPTPQAAAQRMVAEMKGQHELTVKLKAEAGTSATVESQKTTGNASTFNLGDQGILAP